MSDDIQSNDPQASNWQQNFLRVARQLDPTCDAEAVLRYAQEIAAAQTVLDTIDVSEVAIESAFTARWPKGTAR